MDRIMVSILLVIFLAFLVGCSSGDVDVLMDEQDEEALTTDDTLQDEDDEAIDDDVSVDEQDEETLTTDDTLKDDDESTRDLLQSEYKEGYREWCDNNLDTGTCASKEKIICQSEVIAQNTEYPDEFLRLIKEEGFESGQARFRLDFEENLNSLIIEECLG